MLDIIKPFTQCPFFASSEPIVTLMYVLISAAIDII